MTMASARGMFWLLSYLIFGALAASFPPIPDGITVINSTKFPDRSISFKETTICETTEGVKSYSGYVNLPANPSEGRQFPIHTYFWFFEARNNPESAPLSLWLQGGPGVPSITAAVGENGPCLVLEDSISTELNPWSWNDKVNMLYIDQPVQVGFSYNALVNGTLDEVPTPFVFKPADFTKTPTPETNLTFLTGTFAYPELSAAPNTTIATAPMIWDFMQTFIQDFPESKSSNDRISIWTESYGGHYAPVYANYFEEQNDRIAAGTLNTSAVAIHLDTIGLVNACIDINTQMPSYPEFAFNNTYGIEAITESQYQSAVAATETCRNMSNTCRSMADEVDPNGFGNNTDVNKACLDAYTYCFGNMHDDVSQAEHNWFDIAAPGLESFPPKWAAGYLNTAEIQQALGVPLNFTGNSMVVASVFNLTGDFVRGHGLANLGSLLNRGIKVALVYGDRDYQCNWFGGEAISLAINSSSSADFAKAGYANIQTNASYVGGLVRQHGNLSFSRVFQAGHEVPYYQPETALQIFNRVMFNTDVATGNVSTVGYSSAGSVSAYTKSGPAPAEDKPKCYVWDILETCTTPEKQMLLNGSAIVENYILVGQKQTNGSEIFLNGTTTTSGVGPTSGTPKSGAAGVGVSCSWMMVIAATIVLQLSGFSL